MSWDDEDFYSDDPLVRYNAHQAAKGRPQMPDPDLLRKREREELDVPCQEPERSSLVDGAGRQDEEES